MLPEGPEAVSLGRYSPDPLTALFWCIACNVVEKAVVNAERALIHDHLEHCLDADHSPADRDELKAISRYL